MLLYINGVEVFGPTDFNHKVSSLESSVPLSDNNTIKIVLASRPGSSLTVEIFQELSPVTVSLSATPQALSVGESATLLWNAENAETVTIDQGIGSVDSTGSLSVIPAETTQYTVTATGPSGTATDQVMITVTYPEPTASINVDPTIISAGENSTLAWRTEYAQTCTIEPDIGIVPCTSELTVAPLQDITYTLTASGQGGTVTAQAVIAVTAASPLSLTITSPVNGDNFSLPFVMVTGTITHENGLETGITVNDVIALVYDGIFVANHVPLAEGENSITVTATDAAGNSRQESVIVNISPGTDYFFVKCNYTSGVAPLDAVLQVLSSFSLVTPPTFSSVGPADVMYNETDSADTFDITLEKAGLYFFTATVQDENGTIYTDKVAVLLADREIFETMLKATWNGMKQALAAGNIQEALSYHHPEVRERYEAIYNAVGDQLPTLADKIGELELIFTENGRTKCRVRKEQLIDGNLKTITYYIYLYLDENGIWRIENY